jgi:hypothetical protein
MMRTTGTSGCANGLALLIALLALLFIGRLIYGIVT